jgi:hypothetical protein
VIASGPVEAFVEHWSARYVDPREELYTANIGRALTAERVNSLFIWKNGGPLSAAKRVSVEQHYISRLSQLAALPPSTTAGQFLRIFGGGAIWRIFWLHCWRPDRYPIYDQHVHRSMEYILALRCGEIPEREDVIIASYLERYLPFWGTFPNLSDRLVDKALWTFGKFLKAFPGREVSGRGHR